MQARYQYSTGGIEMNSLKVITGMADADELRAWRLQHTSGVPHES